jgi:hypothetical protein
MLITAYYHIYGVNNAFDGKCQLIGLFLNWKAFNMAHQEGYRKSICGHISSYIFICAIILVTITRFIM